MEDASMTNTDEDPWNWDPAAVELFFRFNAGDHVSDLPHAHLPPLDAFVGALRENDVCGATLLDSVDHTFLKEDCGVTKLGSRNAVLHCIKKLRKCSATYTSQQDPSAQPTPTPYRSLQPQLEPRTAARHDPHPIAATPLSALPSQPPIAYAPEDAEKLAATQTRAVQRPTDQTVALQPDPEQIASSTAAYMSASEEPAAEEPELEHRGPRRRRLDVATLQTEPPRKARRVGLLETDTPYFGDSVRPVDALFYPPSAQSGKPIGALPSNRLTVLKADHEAGLAEQNFQFFGHREPQGDTTYVYSHMQHFMTNAEEVDLRRQDRPAIGIFPYREGVAQKDRSATLFRFTGQSQEPLAIKKDATGMTEDGQEEEEVEEELEVPPNLPDSGGWDFLVSKYKTKGDKEIPALGESDSGDEATDSVDTDSNASDQAEEEKSHENLAHDDAGGFIDLFIRDCVSSWHEKVVNEQKAWSVWRQTKKSRSLRDALIEGAQAQIVSLNTRIGKLKDKLLESRWQNQKSLSKACEVFEVTIGQREEQKWKIEVWKMRHEPTRYIRAKKTGRHVQTLPAQTTPKEPAFIVNPYDRLSASPGPVVREAAPGAGQDQDVRDEGGAQDVDDEFHTPANSPSIIDNDVDMEEEGPTPMPDAIDSESDWAMENEVKEERPSQVRALPQRTNDSNLGDSDNELPSPSTLIEKRKTPRVTAAPMIDLTLSDSSSPVRKPGRTGKVVSTANFSGQPEDHTASEVDNWDMDDLMARSDRKRILIKLLRDIGPESMEKIQGLLAKEGFARFRDQLRDAFAASVDNKGHFAALDERLKQCTHLLSTYQMSNDAPDERSLTFFTQILQRLLLKRTSSLFVKSPSPADGGFISSGDNEEPQNTPHSRRKRLVKTDHVAAQKRTDAKEREKRYQKGLAESQSNPARLATMLGSDPAGSVTEKVAINPAKDDGENFIYIHPKISAKMKQHQVEGVRFLWREITAGDGEGALLAHTMGLGKTMQSIALLAAIAETAGSKAKSVRHQLPQHLRPAEIRRGKRHMRMLILCPPSLLQNWKREIGQWAPKVLGSVDLVESGSKPQAHIRKLQDWQEFGGVLIMGYALFRMLVQRSKADKYTDEQAEQLDTLLLETPEMVVADEAHSFKNILSQVSIAVNKIKTKSRIALSGTPMSNDVHEIYAVVSWVEPGFLGNQTYFRARYEEPIKEGLWQDSTSAEKRKSMIRLKVLHEAIGPKVNRADITVLRGTLKPKLEFVITVPLTPVQITAYSKYVRLFKGEGQDAEASNVRIFNWLAHLMLLTNHPKCFRKKLLTPKAQPKKKKNNAAAAQNANGDESGATTPLDQSMVAAQDQLPDQHQDEDLEPNPGDEDVYSLGFTKEMVEQVVEGLTEAVDPTLSAKVKVLQHILLASRDAGDKVMIFSTSIPTMNYLDELLETMNFMSFRIDGSVPMAMRTSMLEQFHKARFAVFLISTRAGGQGLNIQGANRLVIFDYSWNPMYEEQAIGRAYRLGQTKPVFVYRFVAGGTFEANIYNTQLFKSALSKRVIDKKQPRRAADRNVRDYLYEPRELPQADLTEWIGKDPHVLDKLLSRHGSGPGQVDTLIRGLQTMETLQAEDQDAPMTVEDKAEFEREIAEHRQGRKAAAAAGGGWAPVGPGGIAPPSTALPGVTWPPRSTFAGSAVFNNGVPPPSTMPAGGMNGNGSASAGASAAGSAYGNGVPNGPQRQSMQDMGGLPLPKPQR